MVIHIIFILGINKLGKVITPDKWKSGARNTTGKIVIQKLIIISWLNRFILFNID